MTDLELKLEEIARLLTAKYGQEVGIRAGILSASEATARYCAEIAENFVPPGDTPVVCSRSQIAAAILRECGVKE